MFWVLSASPCNKLLNAHLCAWEMCAFKSWSYLTAQTISSQAEKYFLSRFWFYWAVLHLPELSLATDSHMYTYKCTYACSDLRELVISACYTVPGLQREDDARQKWRENPDLTQLPVCTCIQNTGDVTTMAARHEGLWHIYSNPLTTYFSLSGKRNPGFCSTYVATAHTGQTCSNNNHHSTSRAATARRFLTSAWPCVSHLTSSCLSPSG